jgi:hypothetical protein
MTNYLSNLLFIPIQLLLKINYVNSNLYFTIHNKLTKILNKLQELLY